MRAVMRHRTPWVAALLALVPAVAAVAAPSEPGLVPPVALAVPLAAPPALDGHVLGDPAWSAAPAADGFRQTTPQAGAPASERTEVRFGFTRDALYVAIVCHDSEPDRLVVSDSRRDASLDDTDSVRIALDTFFDRQNGFVFGTNPAAVEYDAQFSREGQGDGDYNLNWDGAWRVRTATGEFGWSAEFEIPFRTLRYPAQEDPQAWGLQVQRNIRRRNETAYWAPIPRQYGLTRVSAAGSLQGVQPPPQRNLTLTPYVLGRGDERAGVPRDEDLDVGGDLKWSVTPSLTLDVTVNTDFAQVEVDEQQVNLDRFSLFFPEKRPFFLENAGFFSMGSSGATELFFSRSIGLAPGGQVVPILGGARLSGRLGGFNVGALNMQTRRVAGLTPALNSTVLRVERELPNRSGVAALFTHQQATGDGAPDSLRGQTYGLDGRLGLGRYGLFSGFVARTDAPGAGRAEHALDATLSLNAPGWEAFVSYTEVGAGFAPRLGFLQRTDFRKPAALLFHSRRMNGWLGLHEIRPHVSYNGYWKPDGFQETGYLHVDNHWEFTNAWEVHTGVNFRREGLRQPFPIYPGVTVAPGTYDHAELQLVFYTDQGKPLSFDNTLIRGGFFGGRRTTLRPTLKVRRGEQVSVQLRYERNDVDLPTGAFVTNLVRARLGYNWSPRLFVQALVQYNDRADLWSTNVRFGWLRTANTGLFVVYSENRDLDERLPGLPVRDRSLVVKWSRRLELLD
jgi:hypothetical protein